MFASQSPSLPQNLPSRMKRPRFARMIRQFTYLSSPYLCDAYVPCRSLNDELTESIRLLNMLARKLKEGRMAAGALNLASPEVKIHMDSAESSDPVDVEQKELRETNSLVEEFMLLANISVAQKIQETFPQTAVLRYRSLLSPPCVSADGEGVLDGIFPHRSQISRSSKIF